MNNFLFFSFFFSFLSFEGAEKWDSIWREMWGQEEGFLPK